MVVGASGPSDPVDVRAFTLGLWGSALKEARGAVVFLDRGACESLRWAGGVERLLQAGATRIKDFSCFQAGGPADTRALFLLSGSVQNSASIDVLHSILDASCFESATVVTSIPVTATPEATVAQNIASLQRQLRQWMGSVKSTVSKVIYMPLCFTNILPNLLVTPSLAGLFPPLLGDDKAGSHHLLPPEKRALLAPLVSALNLLLGQLQLRDQLLSLGRLAYTVADELEHFEGTINRRKGLSDDAKRACVFLVDRSLDLVAPLSNRNENILDAIRDVLPAFDSTDVSVDMSPVCHATGGMTSAGACIAAGTLSCLTSEKRHEIEHLKWKLAPFYLRDEFTSLAQRCGLNGELQSDDDSVQFVRENLQVFKGSSLEKLLGNVSDLVAVAALSEALSNPAMQRRLEKFAVEKIFTQNATETSLSGALDAGEALVHLAEGRDKTKLDFEDLVSMFLYISSLCGEDLYVDQRCHDELQQSLLAALTEEILRDASEWSEITKLLLPSTNPTEAQLQAAVARVKEAGSRVASQRKDLKSLRRVLTKGDLAHPSIYRPLLAELVEMLKANVEFPDVESHTSAGGVLGGIQGSLGFLMGAVGAAMGSSGSGPLEGADVLLLIILGGVTFAEVAMLDQLMSDTDKQFVVVSTSLLTPKETVKHIFTSMT